MLTFVMNASLTAFPHRGLPRLAEAVSEGRSPQQFTPMSGAHDSAADAGVAALRIVSPGPGAAERIAIL